VTSYLFHSAIIVASVLGLLCVIRVSQEYSRTGLNPSEIVIGLRRGLQAALFSYTGRRLLGVFFFYILLVLWFGGVYQTTYRDDPKSFLFSSNLNSAQAALLVDGARGVDPSAETAS
jgi:glycerol uptake facilitator-like aquaporin